jgi:hypothetical protein
MRPTLKDIEKIEKMRDEEKHDEAFDLKHQFDWSSEVTENNGKYGLKNCLGVQVVPNNFEDFKLLDVQFLHEDSCVVSQYDGKWGLLKTDGSGEWILPAEYDCISFPFNLIALQKGDKHGVMNLSTKEFVVPLEQDLVHTPGGFLFENGIAFFEKNGKTGILKDNGYKTEAIFDEVDFDSSEEVKVMFNGVWGYADENGEFTRDINENFYYTDI